MHPCALDLQEVNAILTRRKWITSRELGRELMEAEQKLSTTKNILSITQEGLEIAQETEANAIALLAKEKEYL